MTKTYIEHKTFDKVDFAIEALAKGEYERCIFKGCNFSGSDLSGINFSECEFNSCNLSMVKTNNTGLKGVKFVGCKLLGLHFDNCNTFLFSVPLLSPVVHKRYHRIQSDANHTCQLPFL